MIFVVNESEITQNCILYFYTQQMPFKQRFVKVLNNLSEKYKCDIFAIDVYQFEKLKIKHNITCVPTFIFIKDKIEKSRTEGIVMASALKSKLIKYFGEKNDKN